MSNRRGGQGGRKAKANKNKQAKGGGGNPSTLLPRDDCHNMDLPCCRLLHDVTKELFSVTTTIQGKQPTQQQQPQRPACLLGQMIRNHLFDQRRRADPSQQSTTPSNSKKKKKRKKKKANNNTAASGTQSSDTPASATDAATTVTAKENSSAKAGQEADETDSTPAISSAISQDSQQTQTQTVSSAPSATMIRSSTTSTATTVSSTITNLSFSTTTAISIATDTSTPTVPPAPTTLVDLYLDKLLSIQKQQQQQQQQEGEMEGDTTPVPSTASSSIRDIGAFLQYVNDKHTNTNPKKDSNNKATPYVTQQELEHACQSVACSTCRESVQLTLQHMLHSKQPVVLPSISFCGNKDSDNDNNAHPPNNNSSNHNGLAIPILNEKPNKNNAPPPPAPTMDFDYVAMEEGSSPMGTLLEAKADLEGIPYFHPHQATTDAEGITNTASTTNSTTTNSKKQNKKWGEDSKNKQSNNTNSSPNSNPNQMEWHFVSSSSGTAAKSEGNTTQASYITIQDLDHVVKDLMLPLAIPADEMIEACTDLSSGDLNEVQGRVSTLENEYAKELIHLDREVRNYQDSYNRLDETEEANQDNVAITYVPQYHDLDDALYKVLADIVLDLAWDRLLWMSGAPDMTVIRPTPAWENMVAYLTDVSTQTIMGMMQAVEQYERGLEEIASSQGKLPQMFVDKGHRLLFRTMLETKLRLVHHMFNTVRSASETREEVWPGTTGGRGGPSTAQPQHPHMQPHHLQNASGLLYYFRRKWFMEQEFYRKTAEIQRKEEAAASGKKGPSAPPSNNKAKKDATPELTANDKWVQTLDVYTNDLLRGLIDFAKTVKQGRLADIKEEHMVRCEKHLGLLTRVGQECLGPLVETDKSSSTSFSLKDPNLVNQCRDLWTQIQEQRDLQQQQQLLASDGEGPSIVEQKRTVADLTLSLIRLLRNLRKCVTDSFGPKDAPPLIPLASVAWLTDPQNVENGIDYENLDLSKCSYNSLVCAAAVTGKHQQNRYKNPNQKECIGGSGQFRLTSLLLAIFYRKLSEQCSEWHAELAEQELLTTMGDSNSGVEGTNGISGDPNSGSKKDGATNRNGVNAAIAATPVKANKKSKKKRDKKAASANEAARDIAEPNPSKEQGATEDEKQEVVVPQEASSAVSTNGHQKKTAETKREQDRGKGASAKGASLNRKAAEGASNQRQLLDGGNAKVFSTVRVDKKMGVADPSGAFQTAESYLVGRLTSMLNASRAQAKGGGSVVII